MTDNDLRRAWLALARLYGFDDLRTEAARHIYGLAHNLRLS